MPRLAVLLLAALPASAFAEPAATIDSGAVRGVTAGDVESFKGIPFAAPPVGPLRWQPPQPAARWTGTRAATDYGHDCMQKPFPSDAAPLGTAPSEDCLVLNVWRPAGTKPGTKLPVMVWIYGGGFVNGGSSPAVYDGSAFARQGIVTVSFNYRLGRFGFFAHPALKQGGNFGLMDQQAALQWVKRNIAAFGGDPAQVTIVGESAGGMSVTALLGSPAARGLFTRAVIMSGGGRVDAPLRKLHEDQPGMPSADKVGADFARSVGVEGEDVAALARLRALPAEAIIADLNLATPPDGRKLYTGPVEDGVTLAGSTEAVLARAGQAPVPVMVGATGADIGFLPVKTKDEAFATFGADAAAARADYDPKGDRDTGAVIAAIGGDRFMVEPARHIAAQVAKAAQPVFYYRFSYVADSVRKEWAGAYHASDIPYFFDTVAAKYGAALTPQDAGMAKAMNRYLAAFVKTGVPSAEGLPAWPRFEKKGPMMDFSAGGKLIVGPDPWEKRLDRIEALAGNK